MNTTTQDRIRKAAQDALAERDDASALELLALLAGSLPAAPVAPAALPPSRQIIDGPAHDYHHWARFVRENFIPFMTDNGRLRFTSPELLAWMENRNDLMLTTGDIEEHRAGRETWRNGVSNALAHLKQMGVLTAQPFGKDYVITRRQPALFAT